MNNTHKSSSGIQREWEVKHAARQLVVHASSVSHSYIRNNVLRGRFIRDVDLWGQCLVRDYTQGKKTKSETLTAIHKRL